MIWQINPFKHLLQENEKKKDLMFLYENGVVVIFPNNIFFREHFVFCSIISKLIRNIVG